MSKGGSADSTSSGVGHRGPSPGELLRRHEMRSAASIDCRAPIVDGDSLAGFWVGQVAGLRLLDHFDVSRLPLLVEERLGGTVETEATEPATARHSANPADGNT